jgi:hypothetical protein
VLVIHQPVGRRKRLAVVAADGAARPDRPRCSQTDEDPGPR